MDIPPGNVGHPTRGHHLPGAGQTAQRHAGGPRLPGQTPMLPSTGLADGRVDHIPPADSVPAVCVRLSDTGRREEQRLCPHEPATEIIRQGVGVYATRRPRPDTNTPWATTERGAHIHAYQPTMPCRLPHPDNHNTVILADASGTTSLTPAAGEAALELKVETTGRLHQHHLTGATIFGASSHGELKTLAIVVDAVNDTHQERCDHTHHVWVVVDAAVDFKIVRSLARQPLHKATDSSLGTGPYTCGQPCGASPNTSSYISSNKNLMGIAWATDT